MAGVGEAIWGLRVGGHMLGDKGGRRLWAGRRSYDLYGVRFERDFVCKIGMDLRM